MARITKHIVPLIGKKQLLAVGPGDIETIMDAVTGKGLGSGSVHIGLAAILRCTVHGPAQLLLAFFEPFFELFKLFLFHVKRGLPLLPPAP